MPVQSVNSDANKPVGFHNTQHVGAIQNNRAFNTAESSLTSLSPQEGVGDFFQGIWDILTWPFRATYNLFFGPSEASEKAAEKAEEKEKASLDSLKDFFVSWKSKIIKEKEYAKQFKEAVDGLPLKERQAFRQALHVHGGHQPKDADGASFATRTISKKRYTENDRTLFKETYAMLADRPQLEAMAGKFEECAEDRDVQKVYDRAYDELSRPTKAWIQKLAYCFVHHASPAKDASGRVSTPNFEPNVRWAKGCALACHLLSAGNFKLLPKSGREELEGLLDMLMRSARRGADGMHIKDTDAMNAYNLCVKDPKVKQLLEQAVEVTADCPGQGAAYLKNGAKNQKTGAIIGFDGDSFAGLVEALVRFDTQF